MVFLIWSIRSSFCSCSIGILLLHVFSSTAHSLVCNPLDSINEPHLQQANYAYTVHKILGFGGRNLIVQLPVATGGLAHHFVRASLRFPTSLPSTWFHRKMQGSGNLLCNRKASGVHSARLYQVSPTSCISFNWTVWNLHSRWFQKQMILTARKI